MIALLLLLVLVTSLGLVAAWLGENPGIVTLTWFGYQVETSAALLVLVALLLGMFVTFVYNVLRGVLLAPHRYSQYRTLKHYRAALTEITHSVAALAASDITSATTHTKRAEKALGITPLTLLLHAQISKSAGNDETTRGLLEQLLEHPETEYLAAKSLAEAARKQEKLTQALTLAERAHRVNPRGEQGAWSVLELHLANHNFQEAEIHARHARKIRVFSRADYLKARGMVALAQARASSTSGHKDNALVFALKSVKLLPGNLEAAELCAQLAADNHEQGQALSIIQRQWKTAPSKVLADMFNQLMLDEKPAYRQKLTTRLIDSNPAAAENLLLTTSPL